ncbi:hypothetical protein IFR05_005467 [Cadophora sp. M221]|nr:hypothetical protein IFR05_005467 [Cadophora sp. M221]
MALRTTIPMFLHLLFLVVIVCVAAPAQFGEPFLSSNASLLSLKRSTSQDPSCPSGFLCEQTACPANVVCPSGERCVNFEGTLGCVPNAGLSFCAINPESRLAVGCNQGVCCHGNCYIDKTVCCDRPSVQCSVGQLCNACPSGQTCNANSCSGDPNTDPPTTTTTKPTDLPVPTTTPVNPTVVPTAGTFKSIGCFADADGNRVLTNGSSVDHSTTGMTVEKCAELANGYQYAGVENNGECYWGDLLSYQTSKNIAECNDYCNGDLTEICGGENRILLYQDVAWVLLTDAEYAAALQEFQALLQQLQTAVAKWHQDLNAYYAAIKEAAPKRRKRASVSLTQQGITLNLDREAILQIMKPKTIKLKLISLDYYLKIKINQRQKNAEAAAKEFKDAETFINTVTEEIAKPNLPVEIIGEGVIPTAAQVEAVSTVVTAGTEIAATLGGAAVIVDGAVVAVATGIFATLAAVLAHFLPAGPPGGGGNDPPATTTTKTTSSSSTCSPTMSPTAMVILMTEDATAAQYKDLVLSIPDAPNHVEIFYELVNFRVLIADINDCDIKRLWDNPIVEAMSRDGPYILDDEADAPIAVTKRKADNVPHKEFKHSVRDESNVTFGLSGRTLDESIEFRTQPNSPWHLKLVSGLSHQIGAGLNGLFYDFPGYLFADRSVETATHVSEVNLYILDTGIRITHSDFAGRQVTALDATGTDATDKIGHGTHMCSVSAGNYAGVAKNANIVSVKKSNNVGVITRAIGMILDDVARHEFQGRAVINMSFGAELGDLFPDSLPQGAQGPRIDIIGAMLPRLYQSGIVVVCSAGNFGNFELPLTDKTPRMHGGRDTPLIVVGATTDDERRWYKSQVVDLNDQGILTIYANGVNVLSAGYKDDDAYTIASGTSEATALTSGLIAYLISNDVLQADLMRGSLNNFASAVKAHIRQLGTSMKGISRVDPVDGSPDIVPRVSNGEAIECPTQNGQVAQPVYQVPLDSQEILPAAYPTILVSEGLEVVVPQNQLPSCVRRP